MEDICTLRIGGVPEHFNYPWHYAQEEGIFFDYGLAVEWQDYPAGTGAMVQALRNKELDVALLLTEGAINAIANDLRASIVQFYVDSPLVWGIHTNEANKNKSVVEMEDRRYAISRKGSGSHLMAFVDAQNRGVDTSSLHFEVVENLPGAIQSIQADQTNLFFWEKFTTKPFVDKGDLHFVDECPTPWPCFVMVVRNELLINKSECIKKLQQAILQATKEISKQDGLNQVISERYDLLIEDVDKWLSLTKWTQSTSVKKSILSKAVSTLYDLKIINTQITPQELCSDFTNLS